MLIVQHNSTTGVRRIYEATRVEYTPAAQSGTGAPLIVVDLSELNGNIEISEGKVSVLNDRGISIADF